MNNPTTTSREPAPRVRLRFDDVERGLHIEEAMILEDWLANEKNLAAQGLAGSVRSAMETGSTEPIELDADELTALANVMASADVGDCAGLKLLKDTLRGLDGYNACGVVLRPRSSVEGDACDTDGRTVQGLLVAEASGR